MLTERIIENEYVERPLSLSISSNDTDFYSLVTGYTPFYNIDIPLLPSIRLKSSNDENQLYLQRIVCELNKPSENDRILLSLLSDELSTIVHKDILYREYNILFQKVMSNQRHLFCDTTNTYLIGIIGNNMLMVVDQKDISTSFSYKGKDKGKEEGHNNEIFFYKKDKKFVFDLKKDDMYIHCMINDNVLHSTVSNKNKTQKIKISIDNNGNIIKNYFFSNTTINLRLLSHTLYTNEKIVTTSNKDGLISQSTFVYDTKIEKYISQYMMNDPNSGLRYRGKYEEEKKDGSIVKKTLTTSDGKSDTVVYNKEDNIVTVDVLQRTRKENEIVIGWKVVKSASGELRILKLGIPADADIVMPIDSEFFRTRGKERCNRAIVMDIQKALKEEEISVVPDEIIAYSYLFTGNENNPPFSYKLGSAVVPDFFDPNEDESCTGGIHFYRNRNDVFDVYVRTS
jgi:hypothetical protein